MQGVLVACAASVLGFAVLYLLLTRRIRKLVDPETILGMIRKEIEALIVELNQTTERSISLMEEEVKTLSGVLQKAERRVAVLRREAAALEQSERAYATLRRMPLEAERGARAEQKLESRDSKDDVPAPAPPDPEETAGEGDVRARIVSLHRAGISVDSIARRVNLPRAKVELIVSLEEEGAP